MTGMRRRDRSQGCKCRLTMPRGRTMRALGASLFIGQSHLRTKMSAVRKKTTEPPTEALSRSDGRLPLSPAQPEKHLRIRPTYNLSSKPPSFPITSLMQTGMPSS